MARSPHETAFARRLPLVVLAAGLWSAQAAGGEWRVRVDDGTAPLADAVVSLHAASAPTSAAGGAAIMDQVDTAFVPGVLAIQAGTSVSFPNSDKVQHQVYSFSAAKPFELPLYAGTPSAPVRFDRAGVVVVGCNIHDWMIGYIVVLDTPYFARTAADGKVRLQAPPGNYRLRVWHPRLTGEFRDLPVQVGLKPGSSAISLVLGPPPALRQGSDRVRALQEKLRRLKRDP